MLGSMERRYAMHIIQKLILVTFTMLAAGAAMANDPGAFLGQSIGPVAELTPDERARFRERWREMPPDQRDAVRDRLRQDWQNLPPEERQRRRQDLMGPMRDHGDAAQPGHGRHYRDEGFGQGYGTRQ
jgi:hypothetical protein